MVENKNKSILMAVAAGAALVGAALLYHFVFADAGDEEAPSDDQILKLLQTAKLDKVQKAPNGVMLHPHYMLKLLNFITQEARKRRTHEREAALKQRRQFFTDSKWDEYRDIIKEQFIADDTMCNVVMEDVLRLLTETSMQEVQMTMQMMAQDPQMSQMLMAAQQGKLPSEDQEVVAKPKLEKSKTLKAF